MPGRYRYWPAASVRGIERAHVKLRLAIKEKAYNKAPAIGGKGEEGSSGVPGDGDAGEDGGFVGGLLAEMEEGDGDGDGGAQGGGGDPG